MAKLTEKQEKFAQLVGAKGLGQTAAYREAYSTKNMTDKSVWEVASRMLADVKVRSRIEELKAARNDAVVNEITFGVQDLMKTFLAIAGTDPNELISVKVGCCRHCHGVGFEYQWREREYMDAVGKWEQSDKGAPCPDPSGGFGYRHAEPPHPDCPQCCGEGVTRVVPMDTTKLSAGARHLYRGVQQTKDGIKVLFADKDKTLDQIGRMLGAFDDKLRVDLEGKIASLKLTTSDPKEAADAYARMISGG